MEAVADRFPQVGGVSWTSSTKKEGQCRRYLFLGRFLGLSCFLMCTVLVARPKASLESISSMMESPGLILVTGIFNIAGGAAMVVGHNVWSGGALPVAVTLFGLVDADQGRRPNGDALACTDRLLPGAALSGVVPPYMAAALVFSAWLTVTAFLA
jgi:hypothetical protein